MRSLLMVRHAKSSWADPTLADHARPLNKRGQRDAPKMGRWLASLGLLPDMVLSSSAVRARLTAEAMLEAAGIEPTLRCDESLYPTEPRIVEAFLRASPDEFDCIMVIGHNPGMESLVLAAAGSELEMPTAAIAHLRVDIDRWAEFVLDGRGTLLDVWRPREIDA